MVVSAMEVRAPTAVQAPSLASRRLAVGWMAGSSESAGRLRTAAGVDIYYVNISAARYEKMNLGFRLCVEGNSSGSSQRQLSSPSEEIQGTCYVHIHYVHILVTKSSELFFGLDIGASLNCNERRIG